MKRILSLNDQLATVEIHKEIFERAGYDCLTATNDEWALAILRTLNVDLLIQDIKRPSSSVRGKDGWSFLSLLKSDPALKDIPVLIVSAASTDTPEYAYYRDRLAGFLQVPVDAGELLEVVGKFLTPRPIQFAGEIM